MATLEASFALAGIVALGSLYELNTVGDRATCLFVRVMGDFRTYAVQFHPGVAHTPRARQHPSPGSPLLGICYGM